LVLDDYDINADVGPAAAIIKTFTTTVSDGMLNIKFVSVVNRAKVSGICVRPNPEQPLELCAETHTVTVTDANGCTVMGVVMLCNTASKLADGNIRNDNVRQASKAIIGLKVYPIPFDDILSIGFGANEKGEAQIRIVDMLGKIIKSQKLDLTAVRTTPQ